MTTTPTPDVTRDPTFQAFCEAVRELLDETAASKGYQQDGPDSPNPIHAFVAETAGGPGHALREIIFKVRRYSTRRGRTVPRST